MEVTNGQIQNLSTQPDFRGYKTCIWMYLCQFETGFHEILQNLFQYGSYAYGSFSAENQHVCPI